MTNPVVPTNVQAGPAQSVVVVTDTKIEGGPAIPVYGWTGNPTDGRGVEGGNSLRVVVISASDLQINGGKFSLEGDAVALPVASSTGGVSEGGTAIAVYPVNSWP